MTWGVFELRTEVHVIPLRDDGEPFFHETDRACLCEPTLAREDGDVRDLFVHHSATEHHRNVLRVWNLRREMRGKRRGWLMR